MFGLPWYGATSTAWRAYNTSLSHDAPGGWACRCDDTRANNTCNYRYWNAANQSAFPAGHKDPALVGHARHTTYQFFCKNDSLGNTYYNDMASIFLTGRENAILSLIEAPHRFSFTSLLLIGVAFFLLMLLAFGAAYPAGIFMPTVVIGTAFGALFGQLVKFTLCKWGNDNQIGWTAECDWDNFGGSAEQTTDHQWVRLHAGPYALLGAVALLGGVQRSSLSLVVIIVEGTGKIDYLLPIILTTVCAKWVGDKLNDGFYHTALHIKGIPFLDNDGMRGLQSLTANDIMSANPMTIPEVASVKEVIDILESSQHEGFPVVREMDAGDGVMVERCHCGTILRSSLLVLLDQRRFFREAGLAEGENSLAKGSSALGSTLSSGLSSYTQLERVEDTLDRSEETSSFSFFSRSKSKSRNGSGSQAGSGSDSARESNRTSNSLLAGFDDMEEQDEVLSPETRQTVLMVHQANHRSHADKYSARILERFRVDDADHEHLLNVGEAMNRAPYHVLTTTPAQKVHRLFRTMGLRHLVVCDELNRVDGMITRGDLIACMHDHHGEDGASLHV
jgi:CBS domain-containing protein